MNPLMLTTTGSTISPERATDESLNVKWELLQVDNAQRSTATQSNILYETVNEGLWGISSQGMRAETCDSAFSLYIKSH